MRLNKHCTLLLLIAILLIPSQDLLAKKKKQVKEPTDRELWAGCVCNFDRLAGFGVGLDELQVTL